MCQSPKGARHRGADVKSGSRRWWPPAWAAGGATESGGVTLTAPRDTHSRSTGFLSPRPSLLFPRGGTKAQGEGEAPADATSPVRLAHQAPGRPAGRRAPGLLWKGTDPGINSTSQPGPLFPTKRWRPRRVGGGRARGRPPGFTLAADQRERRCSQHLDLAEFLSCRMRQRGVIWSWPREAGPEVNIKGECTDPVNPARKGWPPAFIWSRSCHCYHGSEPIRPGTTVTPRVAEFFCLVPEQINYISLEFPPLHQSPFTAVVGEKLQCCHCLLSFSAARCTQGAGGAERASWRDSPRSPGVPVLLGWGGAKFPPRSVPGGPRMDALKCERLGIYFSRFKTNVIPGRCHCLGQG